MINYEEYLKSEEWRKKRQLVLEFWNHECAICAANDNLHIHHRTYIRLGHEKLTDLIALCKTCHDLFHSRGKRGRLWYLHQIFENKTPIKVLQMLREEDGS